jgi:hypothetical protein
VEGLALALDQLEEAFTLQERFSVEDRSRFFRAIAALARSGYVWIVATLRSDFYSRCEEVSENRTSWPAGVISKFCLIRKSRDDAPMEISYRPGSVVHRFTRESK